MKKIRLLLISLVLIISLNITNVFAISFSDLQSEHWAYNNIMMLVEEGIVNGYIDGTYKPEREITRAEFIKLIMVALYEGNEYFEINNFNFGHWGYPYAIEAAQLGYLMDGTDISNLDSVISRKEMVHILAKVCINNRIETDEEGAEIKFTDTASLDDTTRLYIRYVTENGLIKGYTDGTFKADRGMTRAEVATVISRFIKLKD